MIDNMSAANKQLAFKVKIQIPAGKANPAPPVGTALGPRGVNIMEFCKGFNEQTKDMGGDVVTALISIYKDKSFTFVVKASPVSVLIKKHLKINSGSKNPGKEIIGFITKAQVEEIAKLKMQDMSVASLTAAIKNIEGTARSMGIEVKE